MKLISDFIFNVLIACLVLIGIFTVGFVGSIYLYCALM